MITIAEGNLIQTDAEALVNTVNCEGFMGKGIALQFKKAHPANFKAYARACRAGEVQPGRMFVFATGSMTNPKYIINFPTKRQWREKSRYFGLNTGATPTRRCNTADFRLSTMISLGTPPKTANAFSWQDRKNSEVWETVNSRYMRLL